MPGSVIVPVPMSGFMSMSMSMFGLVLVSGVVPVSRSGPVPKFVPGSRSVPMSGFVP